MQNSTRAFTCIGQTTLMQGGDYNLILRWMFQSRRHDCVMPCSVTSSLNDAAQAAEYFHSTCIFPLPTAMSWLPISEPASAGVLFLLKGSFSILFPYCWCFLSYIVGSLPCSTKHLYTIELNWAKLKNQNCCKCLSPATLLGNHDRNSMHLDVTWPDSFVLDGLVKVLQKVLIYLDFPTQQNL